MKGFIELTSTLGYPELLNVNSIEAVYVARGGTKIKFNDADELEATVKETYEEIKKKISEAME